MSHCTRRQFCKGLALGLGSAAGLAGCNSLQVLSTRGDTLAADWDSRKKRYKFVIIGSGYGGSIAAARLAAHGTAQDPAVCLLERGEEWPVGMFPDSAAAVARSIRTPAANPLGLFEFRISPDISVVQGCGLGGTSLINGNVSIAPPVETFENGLWPQGVTLDSLRPYMSLATAMLRTRPHPHGDRFLRTVALQQRADQIQREVKNLDLTVNFDLDGLNEFGVRQRPCTDCGDCVSGCNVGAKNTLALNYLPAARNAGAHIFTRTEVERIRPMADGSWEVIGQRHRSQGLAAPFTMQADNVILAAGTMGTVEILLHSQANGLDLAQRLGHGFSGNGDFLGIAHNGDDMTNVLGIGNRPNHPFRGHAPGPTIIGGIQYGDTERAKQFIVMDTCIPSALVKGAMLVFGALPGEDMDQGDERAEFRRLLRNSSPHPYHEHNALNHTSIYLVMANDGANGIIELDDRGRATARFGRDGQEIFQLVNQELREHARTRGAKYIPNPVWTFLDGGALISVHPLGGCAMADDHERGVVDEFGRVFRSDGTVHRGLFVADASIMPTSLGVNPLLTISALSERIAERIALDHQG